MSRFFSGAFILGSLLLTVQNASAQQFGAEASVGYFTLSGDDFEGTEAGIGFDGQLFYSPTPNFDLGVGVTRSSHDTDAVDQNIAGLLVYIEPRFRFASNGASVVPFIGARAGWARQSLEVQGTDLEATGFGIGAIGGLGIPVSETISVQLTATFTRLSFGDVEVGGSEVSNTDSSGNALGLQAGVRISFPQK